MDESEQYLRALKELGASRGAHKELVVRSITVMGAFKAMLDGLPPDLRKFYSEHPDAIWQIFDTKRSD